MSDREGEFLKRWQAEKPSYILWGRYVTEHIYSLIGSRVDPRHREFFVRIPAEPRIKDDQSLLQKAFHRGKNYSAPFDDIEDKVGVRFVLLLTSDVKLVGRAIEEEKAIWTAVKARDHEEEIARKPYEFDYQSLHYVVRSASDFDYDGQSGPANLPCEVQIRTLLQHAYSEVTHDTLYKPEVRTTPEMKRAAAKSMALIEATGDYFDKLDALISEELAPLRELDVGLAEAYARIVGRAANATGTPLNELLLDRYGRDINMGELNQWLDQHSYIGQRIAEKAETIGTFRVPAILLVYYSVELAPHGTPRNCPIDESYLQLIYSDLGQSLTG